MKSGRCGVGCKRCSGRSAEDVSIRAARACALFGVSASGAARAARVDDERTQVARLLVDRVQPGEAVLITGPSGGGKTTLLRAVAGMVPRGQGVVHDGSGRLAGQASANRGAGLVDQFDLEIEATIRLLTRVGLGEPRLFTLPIEALSDGERHRAGLAMALASGAAGATGGRVDLCVDEFGSVLDRFGAQMLAAAVRRMLNRSRGDGAGFRLFAATAHEDLGAALEPDVWVRVDQRGAVRVTWARGETNER